MTSKEGLMQMKDFLGVGIAGRKTVVEKLHEKEKEYLSNEDPIPYEISYELHANVLEIKVLEIAYWRLEQIIDKVTD